MKALIGLPRGSNQTKREGIMGRPYEKPNESLHSRMDQDELDQFAFWMQKLVKISYLRNKSSYE